MKEQFYKEILSYITYICYLRTKRINKNPKTLSWSKNKSIKFTNFEISMYKKFVTFQFIDAQFGKSIANRSQVKISWPVGNLSIYEIQYA